MAESDIPIIINLERSLHERGYGQHRDRLQEVRHEVRGETRQALSRDEYQMSQLFLLLHDPSGDTRPTLSRGRSMEYGSRWGAQGLRALSLESHPARQFHRRAHASRIESRSRSHLLKRRATSSTHICPIDIRAQRFACHKPMGFSLDRNTQIRAESLICGNDFSQVTDGRATCLGKGFLSVSRKIIEVGTQGLHTTTLPLGMV